jgi:hypothetical protein
LSKGCSRNGFNVSAGERVGSEQLEGDAVAPFYREEISPFRRRRRGKTGRERLGRHLMDGRGADDPPGGFQEELMNCPRVSPADPSRVQRSLGGAWRATVDDLDASGQVNRY